MNELNIFQRMAGITAELQTVAKNLTVQQTKNSSYKAVSERDILDAVKPLEAKYGVYSYPVSREVLESNMLESESTYNGTPTKKTTFMTRIKTVYRFVNIEKPEEYIETVTFAEGMDTQDKGSGKAMTYSDKYALMKGYKISTGEDPDQTASEDNHYRRAVPNNNANVAFKEAVPKTIAPEVAPIKETPRETLIKMLKAIGKDPAQYAAEKGLSKETTEERYIELIKELNNESIAV